MEGLLKQVRSKFSWKEDSGSIREGRTPLERKPSFKGERKPQKWLRRQFSRQMSFNESAEEEEYAAAVAAAAFAITSLESDNTDQRRPEGWHTSRESDIRDQRRPEVGRMPSLPRILSGIMGIPAVTPEPSEAPRIYEDEHYDDREMIPEKTIHPVPSIKRTPTAPRKRLTFADEYGNNKPFIERTPTFNEDQVEDGRRMKPTSIPSFRRTPTVKKTPTFGEERMEDTRQAKSPKAQAPQPILPPPIPPPPAVPPLNIEPPDTPKRAPRHRLQETDADEWEREEMARIKERYQKLNWTILEWEDKKKKKARRKLEMTENDREKRRAKAMHNYQSEMERIKQIADGARAQAKEKRRNEELKVKEKANKYRATGEPPLPPLCSCL